jgi:hypothetical protein
VGWKKKKLDLPEQGRDGVMISALVRVAERRERGVSRVESFHVSVRNGGTFSLFESPPTAERDMRARFDLGLSSGVKIWCDMDAMSVVDAEATTFGST